MAINTSDIDTYHVIIRLNYDKYFTLFWNLYVSELIQALKMQCTEARIVSGRVANYIASSSFALSLDYHPNYL